MILNKVYTKSPAILHRIPSDVRIFPEESLVSKSNKLSKHLKNCMTNGTIPDVTVVEGCVSRYGNIFCNDGNRGAMGISTFVPFDDSDDALKAAHALHDKDGTQLNCFVLPQDCEIVNHNFLYDRNIATCNPLARHVLIYPIDDTTSEDSFNSIANCQYPIGTWQMCRCQFVFRLGPTWSELSRTG